MKKLLSLSIAAALSSASFAGFAATLPADLKWISNNDEPLFASEEAKRGGTYTTYLASFPQTLRSVGPTANSGIRGYLMDGTPKLAQRHPNTGKYIPQLATSWAFGDDNKTVYFKLDPTAKWNDGEKVTADDYLFMLTYNRSKDIVDPWYTDFFTNTIVDVVKYDDYTISITQKEELSQATLMSNINLPSNGVQPRPEHFYANDKGDKNGDGMPDNFVKKYNFKSEPTTGAYYLDKVKKGKSLTFKHVGEDWWGYSNRYYKNRYNVEKIRMSVIRDTDIALKHFEKGDLDNFRMVFPSYWHEKSDSEAFEKGYVQKFWGFNQTPQGAGGLWMNTEMPLLNDINVRKGVSHATDFDGMIANVLRGDYSRLPSGMGFGHGDYSWPDAKAPEFDVALAIQYFEKAGFDKVGPDGIRVNEKGERLSFNITYGYPVHTPRIAFFKEQAKKAGLEFNMQMLDPSAYFKYALEKKHQLVFLHMGSGDTPAYWEYLHSDNAKPQTNAFNNFSDPALDKLIDAYRAEFDETKRAEISHQIQKIVEDANIIVPGYMVPYDRQVHWRWVKFPSTPMTKQTELIFSPIDLSTFWIDTEVEKETREAMKAGKTFEKVVVIDDKFKV
ncbi:extracellular solute-binding protein [Veronia pacifica]|uniref:Diguanylate cyclase n=1 Tax=Veronia pacifica TaxID=1080227 RepID=A0A1C3ES53_9GAMM|nr:extracellular solute-binding protein [Veronia pacifica]ODA36051.1 diguanylate cyclase [Veronia pacifica]